MSQMGGYRIRLTALLAAVMALLSGAPGEAAESAVPSRVVERVDEGRTIVLAGHTHPAARAEFDRGAVASALPLSGLRLVLQRSAAQEVALESFMQAQIDPRSVHYHQWLTPAQFGAAYGPSDADIQLITNWLLSEGFTVEGTNAGRTFLRFSGTAAAVQHAFHTEMHYYLAGGTRHIANNADPSIPIALRPVIAGISSLHDFFPLPLHDDMGAVVRDTLSGKWQPVLADEGTHPLMNVKGQTGLELLSPQDFAAIYGVAALWNAGVDGTGQTIAIAGRSDINPADVAAFRAAFGLPARAPRIVVNGADPGIPSPEDKTENTLDVEWSGAVARGASIVFVTSASSATADGAQASAEYIVEHQVAPVMSFSYGACELEMGAGGNAAYNALWQQAAAEGISVFVASGDQGAAACDAGGTAPYGARGGYAVSGTSSTPYDVSVGGTDFNWANLPGKSFWSGSNSATGASALGYIPEVPWNSTCASTAVDAVVGGTALGLDPEQTCQAMISQRLDLALVSVVGGTGGTSTCTTPTSGAASGCAGGYPKPSWQSGTGVPADGHRDVPDVSLFAASGALGTAYVICDSDAAPCNYSVGSDAVAQAVGGTSVAAPAMAGIMALVNQKMGSAQGNPNMHFYALAALDNRTSCNSVTVGPGNACNFYDVTTDSNAVPCVPGSANCQLHHSGDQVGILTGYASTTGYDRATGLGSVNAYNLVNNWHLVAAAATTVKIPNVVGSTQAAATTALGAAGLALGTVTQQSSASVASGKVVSESPAAASSVAPGTKVNLVVSTGPAMVKVPNVVGSTQAAATTALGAAGLALGTVTQQSSASVGSGKVVSESPAAASSVAQGTKVNLVVSTGPAPKK